MANTNPIEDLIEKIERVKTGDPLVVPYAWLCEELARISVDLDPEDDKAVLRLIFRKIDRAEEIWRSSADEETKYDSIFGLGIWQAADEAGYTIEWSDPDTSYEEDTAAYMQGLREWRERKTPLLS